MHRRHDVDRCPQAYVSQGVNAPAQLTLDGQPACRQSGNAERHAGKAATVGIQSHAKPNVTRGSASGHEGVGKTRKKVLDHLKPSRQQPMRMDRMGRALARCRMFRQRIAFEQQNFGITFRQHPGGH